MCTDGGFPGAVKVVMKGKFFFFFKSLMGCKMTDTENEGGEGV